MYWIDWFIVVAPVVVVLGIVLRTRRYVRGVADFLAAGRCAGRYLVCNASGEAAMGAVSVVALFEMYYNSGFAVTWWQALSVPVSLVMTLSGFVIYRYRETRAMTLAQFLEMRYSRRFRIFMGLIAFVSGVVNYGIFPAVGARFFVYYCGFPQTMELGGASVPTFALVMAVLLGCALAFALIGGQLTAMVADCVEGMFSGAMYVVVAAALLWLFGWSQISQALTDVPANQSLVHPFQTSQVKDFNIWFVLIGLASTVYGCMAWQGNQGFNCSAASPHEAKMGRILGNWRNYARVVMVVLLAISAYTYLHHPTYSSQASRIDLALEQIHDTTLAKQMRVPVTLRFLLPVGIKGIFASVMLFALIACDSSYLHSWGSIFIQDVVLPFRKQPLKPEQHIRLLRWSIAGVAAFAFLFSLLFRQTEHILMFFAVTGAIFLGGAGSVIIGGLYWKKGTPSAAWSAMITGSSLAVGGIVIQQLYPEFPINGQYMFAIAMGSAMVVYIVVSLLTCRQSFNLDQLLHRGRWAVDERGNPLPEVPRPPRTWKGLLGVDCNFSRGDRFQALLLFTWSVFWLVVFVVVTIWNLFSAWPTSWWVRYWYYVGLLLPIAIGIVTTVWFTWGGIRDLRRLFAHLATAQRDAQDNGTAIRQKQPESQKAEGACADAGDVMQAVRGTR